MVGWSCPTTDVTRVREQRVRMQKRGAEVTTTIAGSQLTAADRCDRCGAQAYVRATMGSGFELLFCAHHWFENEERLRDTATDILDETHRLGGAEPAATAGES